MDDARIVKPYIEIPCKFGNAMKRYSDDFYLLPTIGVSVNKQDLCALLRYPDGAFCRSVITSFKWLVWEFSIAVCRKNYRWKDHISTGDSADEN